MKVQDAGRNVRLDMMTPLELGEFRMHYEGGSGDRHRVRVSRHLPGTVFEDTLVGILDEFRNLRRSLPGGGVLAMAFWLVDSRATYDALMGVGDDD